MNNDQENEFNTFGITKALRKGFLTAILAILLVCVFYLFYRLEDNNQQIINMQGKMYERLLEQQNKTLQGPVSRLNEAANRTDAIVYKVDSVATNTDSINRILLKKLDK